MNTFRAGSASLLDGAGVEHCKLASYLVSYLRSNVVVTVRIEPLVAAFAVHALEEAL